MSTTHERGAVLRCWMHCVIIRLYAPQHLAAWGSAMYCKEARVQSIEVCTVQGRHADFVNAQNLTCGCAIHGKQMGHVKFRKAIGWPAIYPALCHLLLERRG